MKAGRRGPSCRWDGDAGPSRHWLGLAGPDSSDKGLNVQEFIRRCYCQGDGCSRAQLDGLFGVMVGRKERIIPSGWITAAEKKA